MESSSYGRASCASITTTTTATSPTAASTTTADDFLLNDLSNSSSSSSSSGDEAPGPSRSSSTPTPEALLDFLSNHGLERCTPVRLLGTGATCRVDLVHIPAPDDGLAGPSGATTLLAAARKVLPRSRDPHLRTREDAVFHREVEGLRAGLGCPFVVRVLATAMHPDRLELLLELAEGDTLEHELSDALSSVRGELRQPLLPPDRLAQVAASVLTALAALHRQGYAHLDIKPANLLLTSQRRILLGDGGCMQRAGPDGTLTAPASGTPLFAAPEVKRRGGPYGLKADLYSVGVMLAVCAAWHRQTGRVLAWLRGETRLPEYLPEGLRDLVGRLVAADPRDRPSAEEALAHPFLAGVDVAELEPRRGCGFGCAPL